MAGNTGTIEALLRAGQLQAALDACNAQLQAAGGADPELLYVRAVVHRYAGKSSAALADLAQAQQLQPSNGRARQEAGYLYRELGDVERACRAFSQALQLNPALVSSARALAELLLQQGRHEEASVWQQRVHSLEQLPKPLLGAMDLVAQGKLLKAEAICRKILQQAPKHVGAMRLLADIGVRLGILDDAEFLLESAVVFEPENIEARIDYINVLRKCQKFKVACEQAQALLAHAPDNPQFTSILAVAKLSVGEYEAAIEGFDAVLQKLPHDPLTLTSRGHALKTFGRATEAIASYRKALASTVRHGEAWYSLANLKTYQFKDDDILCMRELADSGELAPMDETYIAFALGKAYEDAEAYGDAFAWYARGNAAKKAQSRYRAEQMTAELHAQIEQCNAGLFERHRDSGYSAPDPIFILGLPRAGSTLLEQILASHSQVDGTFELPNMLSMASRLRRGDALAASSRYPAILHDMSPGDFQQLGQEFIEATRIHRGKAPFFIDKMPNNFRHIGLIRLMLPNAKIIDARRHPMACCFSGFKQLFAEGQEFSYDLADIGIYYRDYVRVMDHFDSVLPGAILRVQHEHVVADLETEVRRLLDFCGLPFESDCVEFHRNRRAVRTPSSEQVRQPIFTDSLAQWRHFEPHLAPLKEALGSELLARYPIEDLQDA
jgi:tetratricopeptide (TPR) repeat protein